MKLNLEDLIIHPYSISFTISKNEFYRKNEVELLREKLTKKELELKELYKKKDNSLVGEINKLRNKFEVSKQKMQP